MKVFKHPIQLKKYYRFNLYFLLLLCTGCSKGALSIYTDYLTEESLASYHVGSPDPALNCPPLGQRLLLSWSIPCEYKQYNDLQIVLTIRYYNREEKVYKISSLRKRGTYVIYLLNEEYFKTGGILTYKAILSGDGNPLEEWRHQLWADLIIIEPEKEENESDGT